MIQVHSRYALIRYRSGGIWRVGSGLIVRDGVVLTGDHVARGTGHVVEFAEGKARVKSIIRSGTDEVDLAVLRLAEPVSGVDRLRCARVDRTRPSKVDGCVAVGFPLWRKDAKKRVSVQVEGYVRTADDLRTLAGGLDGQLLTLIGDRVPDQPDLPDGPVDDYGHDQPWGGMSGSVVLARGLVLGVIRSHSVRKGAHTLTVTPLTAINLLPAAKYQEFSAALGFADISEFTLLEGDSTMVAPAAIPAPAAQGATFSSRVSERYAPDIIAAGLEVPDSWSLPALEALYFKSAGRAAAPDVTTALLRARDVLEALNQAVRALPVLAAFGGSIISARKLEHLYLRHVGCRPDAVTLEDMLISAALAGIADRRRPRAQGTQQEALSPLAKFLLGIVGHWTAPGVSLDLAELRDLADYLVGTLGHQREDADRYLAKGVRRQSWALIELDCTKTGESVSGIVVDVVSERGDVESQRFPCAASSREGVELALRDAVNWLPEGDVYVDLCLPERWLGAGLEYWDTVEVAGWYEPMSRHFKPRLRWTMHRHHPKVRDRLAARFCHVDWLADPEDIPADVAGDPVGFAAWLEARDRPGTKYPPCFTGAGATSATGGGDPLGGLLKEGYGFITWFCAGTPDTARHEVVRVAAGVAEETRKEELPDLLAEALRTYRPAIIWSNPDGRADFELPPSRPVGTLRKGGR